MFILNEEKSPLSAELTKNALLQTAFLTIFPTGL